jgi:hypothetical protein
METIVEFENDKMYASVMKFGNKEYSVFYGPDSVTHLNEINGFSTEKQAVKHLHKLIGILPYVEIVPKVNRSLS